MFAPSRPIYPVAGIRAIEALAIPDAEPPLMERAGAAAALLAARLATGAGPVLVACGPGNNGGDGFVMARLLHAAGQRVEVAFAGDPARLPADAAAAHAAWLAAGGTTHTELPPAPPEGWALVVDALFGIGLQRPLEGRYADWIDTLNAQPCPRLAVDIPSGLDADSGRRLGPCFAATHTITFIALKPGLLTLDGPDQCGEVHLAPIDVAAEVLAPAPGREISPALFAARLQPRLRNSHKGSYGDAALIGGAPGMVGAAVLAGRAAAHLGAGRVLLGLLDPGALAVDILRPELMFRAAAELLADPAIGAFAVGPGLGQSDAARALVHDAVRLAVPLVLDADALNLVARDAELQQAVARRSAPTLLTPHPAEAARLLACTTPEVQANRLAATIRMAAQLNAWVVLKGCGSVVASPDGAWWINTSGNPAMATAGMGDVLSGILAALLARGWHARDALLAGVHLHGLAGDACCAELDLDCGLLADEVAPAARRCFNRWIRGEA
ncbi:NAD(P)H-hydrate dehydratase [Zoogloea sp. LCSB751]|uniref:NAD(P)H-hydrate dehydratase n=1 Tax=Zoogloea sp. LCSB751 TaxID=1965277 RepID=UPI0009A4B25A|nr:NAD(P)H-hydrate dehydratase [Zoogloea sp. LCSB751]